MPSWLTSQSSISQRTLVLAQQVRRLLLRSSTKSPLVEIRDHSQFLGAGRGVWSTTHISKQSALCLYPGVYTPGLPLHTMTTAAISAANADCGVAVVYLGKSTTPSSSSNLGGGGADFDQNAYILNVQLPTGGYLDGLALEYTATTTADDKNDETKIHRLDENPNACGHCINHSSTRANAEVIYIDWTDIMLGQVVQDDDQRYYSIPNIVRADKSPWYVVVGEKHNDNIVRFTGHGKCCGAVFCATRDIDPEEEILFDYTLFPPLPSWAKDWYDKSQ